MAKRKIVWSHRARIKLYEILKFYNNRNQNNSYSRKLYKRFTKELNLLKKNPDLGIITEMETVRGLITGEFIIYYQITETKIIVHVIWDCHQNPEDLKIL
jgi:plasmid stabilization system protein ParE